MKNKLSFKIFLFACGVFNIIQIFLQNVQLQEYTEELKHLIKTRLLCRTMRMGRVGLLL